MWIPGIPEEPRLIFSRLAKQNQGLNTSGWRVLYRKKQRRTEGEPQEILLVLGVDDEYLKVLRELGGKVHLEHCKEASSVLNHRLHKMQTDLALVQEPWIVKNWK